ncbi:MAG: Bug family tripartite tricarboxylate transporter substrate binding protein [Pseudolabrys sp.]
MRTFTRAGLGAIAAAAFALTAGLAQAEDYPSRTINLIVPYPAGGGVDTVGRVIANKLSEGLKQQVIVVNKPGAGSVIGVRDAAKSTPDGYTILMLVTGASLPANPGYDLQKDFEPIGLVASIPIVIMAHPSLPVKTMTDIVTLAKKEPGKYNIGTPPSPTLNYFGAEMFKSMTGADVVVVPYKGTGPLTTDLLGGHIKLAFNTLPPAIGNIKAGAIRAVAVAAPERLAAIPDVPTTKEAGLALDIVQYYGLVAPAKTPKAIVARLNAELNKVLAMPDIKQRLIDDGGSAMPSTPAAYAANIKDNESKWAALIKKLGLKVQ